MRWGKLSLILVLTGGIIGFNFAFKNLLVKRLIESALQAVFQAKAEVRGVQFELFSARLKFSTLTVANKDNPMFNLFELGKTEFDMESEEMLKGKVVIQNLECQGIQWNTPRESSGALTPKKQAEKSTESTNESPGLLEMAKINAEEILQQHLAELKSLAFLSNANQELKAFNQKWTNQVAQSKKNVADLEAGFNRVKSMNVAAIKTIPQATQALKEISDFQKSLTAVKSDVQGLKSNISSDFKTVKSTIQQSKTVVQSDLAYLKSLISIPEGGAKGLIKTMLHKVLAQQLGDIYYYANEALGYARTLDQSTPKSKKEQKEMMKAASKRRPGFEVYFPGNGYPNFLLQHLGTSITNKAEGKYLLVDIKDVSSDFNLWNKPLTYKLDRQNQGMGLHLEGLIDPRTNSSESFAMDLSLSSIPFIILDDLAFINITNMTGKYTIESSLILRKDASNQGKMKLTLKDLVIAKGAGVNTVSDILYDILTDSSTIDFSISFNVIQPGSRLEMAVSSSLDGVIQARVGKLINDMVNEATARLSGELNKLAGPLLKDNNLLGGQSLELDKGVAQSEQGLADYQSGIDAKKNEVTAKMNQLKSGVIPDKVPGNIKIPKL